MSTLNALLGVAALAMAGAAAYFGLRKPSAASASPAASGEPLGGLWGLLNEGADSSPFLPQPSAPSSAVPYAPLIDSSAPRGIRNRNPGNVKISGSAWLGKVPISQNTDGTFEQFSEPVYGIRVIAYLLLKYQRDKNKLTIRQLIGEPGGWAPVNSDKNPAGYAATVAREVGQSETAYVDLFAANNLLQRITTAIIRFENGSQPYGADLIARAVSMARDSFR